MSDITPKQRKEIENRLANDISFAPLSEDEILKVIKEEENGKGKKFGEDDYSAPEESGKREESEALKAKREERTRSKPARSFSSETARLISEWEDFYRDVFGIEKDFSDVEIPDKKEGFDRLIVVARGMRPNKLCAAVQAYVLIDKGVVDFDVAKSVRSADKDYAIWVRDGVESDDKLQTKSPNDIIKSGINGITLEERLLLGLRFLYEYGRHIDVQFGTFCTGSVMDANRKGCVPWVYWNEGVVRIKATDFGNPESQADASGDRRFSQMTSRYGGREVIA